MSNCRIGSSIVNFNNQLVTLVIALTSADVVQHTVVSSLDHMAATFSGWGRFQYTCSAVMTVHKGHSPLCAVITIDSLVPRRSSSNLEEGQG